jgi:hypothetical protein
MPDTLTEAVTILLARLEPSEIVEFGSLIPNPKVPAARQRMDWIVDKFHLASPASPLVKDIALRFPDEAVFKGEVFDNANGLFEAEIILRELRRAILELR